MHTLICRRGQRAQDGEKGLRQQVELLGVAANTTDQPGAARCEGACAAAASLSSPAAHGRTPSQPASQPAPAPHPVHGLQLAVALRRELAGVGAGGAGAPQQAAHPSQHGVPIQVVNGAALVVAARCLQQGNRIRVVVVVGVWWVLVVRMCVWGGGRGGGRGGTEAEQGCCTRQHPAHKLHAPWGMPSAATPAR
jgi:hypothetical protein